MTEQNRGRYGALSSAAALAPRVIGFTMPHELYCPRGHHLKEDTIAIEDDVVRCKYREPSPGGKGGGPECGKLLYICLGWQPRGSTQPLLIQSPLELPATTCLFTAEVSYKEATDMRRLRLDVPGVLRFLGVRFPVTALSAVQ